MGRPVCHCLAQLFWDGTSAWDDRELNPTCDLFVTQGGGATDAAQRTTGFSLIFGSHQKLHRSDHNFTGCRLCPFWPVSPKENEHWVWFPPPKFHFTFSRISWVFTNKTKKETFLCSVPWPLLQNQWKFEDSAFTACSTSSAIVLWICSMYHKRPSRPSGPSQSCLKREVPRKSHR